MRVFRLRGHGPLAGLHAYGHVRHLDPRSDDGVVLVLDEPQKMGAAGNERHFGTVTVSAKTGLLKVGEHETDLVCIDTHDMPRLQEARDLWLAGVRRFEDCLEAA